MHRSREARPRPHFHLQMIVIGHQYMGVDLHAKTLRKPPQSLQKIFVTTPNPKNHLSLMPTVHHMIPAVRHFQSDMPGHTPPSNQLAVMSNVKIRPFVSLLIETPTKGAVSEMNQTHLSHQPEKFTTVQPVDPDLERYRDRSVARLQRRLSASHSPAAVVPAGRLFRGFAASAR
jgi:hypothetical protein